ncbi:MAG: response regulator, partial [Nitrospira sp.]|nr:response regulator [Nitrospira sp.]
ETILLVEDEEKVRSLMGESLGKHGYTVLEAENGLEALRISEQYEGPIHLTVTDMIMPQMGGRELVEHLVSLHLEMKVLYISGYTDNTFIQHSLSDPNVAFLQKPFTPDTLVRKVREVLDAK